MPLPVPVPVLIRGAMSLTQIPPAIECTVSPIGDWAITWVSSIHAVAICLDDDKPSDDSTFHWFPGHDPSETQNRQRLPRPTHWRAVGFGSHDVSRVLCPVRARAGARARARPASATRVGGETPGLTRTKTKMKIEVWFRLRRVRALKARPHEGRCQLPDVRITLRVRVGWALAHLEMVG